MGGRRIDDSRLRVTHSCWVVAVALRMVMLVRSRLVLGGGGSDGTAGEEGEVGGWGDGTAEGTNPLTGSFHGNC